ncbi:MAG: hypothetical protein ACOY3I_04490 [Verrucomicrobiota bacterium]
MNRKVKFSLYAAGGTPHEISMGEIPPNERKRHDIIRDICRIITEECAPESEIFKDVCEKISKHTFQLEEECGIFKGNRVSASEIGKTMKKHLLDGGAFHALSRNFKMSLQDSRMYVPDEIGSKRRQRCRAASLYLQAFLHKGNIKEHHRRNAWRYLLFGNLLEVKDPKNYQIFETTGYIVPGSDEKGMMRVPSFQLLFDESQNFFIRLENRLVQKLAEHGIRDQGAFNRKIGRTRCIRNPDADSRIQETPHKGHDR